MNVVVALFVVFVVLFVAMSESVYSILYQNTADNEV